MSAPRLRIRALSLAAAVLALPAFTAAAHAATDDDALPLVAVTTIIRNAAIDALYTGMTDALRSAGYRDGETLRLRFESADTDAAKAAESIRSFSLARADVIVALTEPSARIAASERLRAPLVIGGIAQNTAEEIRRDRKARQLTGVVDAQRYDATLALIREIVPAARTVAIPFDSDNPPAEDALDALKAFARSADLKADELPVSLQKESIAAKIKDYSPDDTVILLDTRLFPDAPVERIVAAADAVDLPVFASDEDTVVRGALAAIVPDSYGTGLQIGHLVARILQQASAAHTSLQPAEPSFVVINQDTAERAGIDIPQSVRARRGRVIGWADADGPRPRRKPAAPEPPPAPAPGEPAEPAAGTANPRSR